MRYFMVFVFCIAQTISLTAANYEPILRDRLKYSWMMNLGDNFEPTIRVKSTINIGFPELEIESKGEPYVIRERAVATGAGIIINNVIFAARSLYYARLLLTQLWETESDDSMSQIDKMGFHFAGIMRANFAVKEAMIQLDNFNHTIGIDEDIYYRQFQLCPNIEAVHQLRDAGVALINFTEYLHTKDKNYFAHENRFGSLVFDLICERVPSSNPHLNSILDIIKGLRACYKKQMSADEFWSSLLGENYNDGEFNSVAFSAGTDYFAKDQEDMRVEMIAASQMGERLFARPATQAKVPVTNLKKTAPEKRTLPRKAWLNSRRKDVKARNTIQ